MKLRLPNPPSPNAIWRAVRGRVIKSAEYRAWIQQAGLELMAQRPRPVAGPVKVEFLCEENGRRDLDGYCKAVLDLIVTHKLIDGDRCNTVRQITMGLSKEIKGVEVSVFTPVDKQDIASSPFPEQANQGL